MKATESREDSESFTILQAFHLILASYIEELQHMKDHYSNQVFVLLIVPSRGDNKAADTAGKSGWWSAHQSMHHFYCGKLEQSCNRKMVTQNIQLRSSVFIFMQ